MANPRSVGSLAALLASCAILAGCDGPWDPGVRYRAFLMLERWERSDPAARHTIAALQPFRSDDKQPSFTWLDSHCGHHRGDWRRGDPLPPSHGITRMRAPALGEVAWNMNGGSLISGYEPEGGAMGWDSGDRLEVTALGGDLPGFHVEAVVPERAELTSHDLEHAAARSVVIVRGEPLELTWDPVASEVIALFLQFEESTYLANGLWCFFPGAAGSAQVPVEAMNALLPTSAITNTNFYFGGAVRQQLALEGVDLESVTWKARAARVLVQ